MFDTEIVTDKTGGWEENLKKPHPDPLRKEREKERRNNARCVAPLLSEGSGEALESMLSDMWSNTFEQLEHCSRTTGAML